MSKRIEFWTDPKSGKTQRVFRQYRMPQCKAVPESRFRDSRNVLYTRLNNGQIVRGGGK